MGGEILAKVAGNNKTPRALVAACLLEIILFRRDTAHFAAIFFPGRKRLVLETKACQINAPFLQRINLSPFSLLSPLSQMEQSLLQVSKYRDRRSE